jgi:hypothetical protein
MSNSSSCRRWPSKSCDPKRSDAAFWR